MKKFFIIILLATLPLTVSAQDRTKSPSPCLSMKSQEITKAKFWTNTASSGWKSRKNTARPYYGEGVHTDNFQTMFIGEYKGYKYLFLDFFQGSWRYPNSQVGWRYYRYMYQALLTEDDFNRLKDLEVGEVFTFQPRFYYNFFKGDKEYSPQLLLEMTETLRSTNESLFKSKEEQYETESAERMYRKDHPLITLLVVKRTISDGKDVVRFLVYPHALAALIDKNYFEVSYDYYQRLFTPDKTVKFY